MTESSGVVHGIDASDVVELRFELLELGSGSGFVNDEVKLRLGRESPSHGGCAVIS